MADFHGLDIGWMQAQYRDCRNKREQLEIFGDLTGAERAEILEVLGVSPPPLKRRAPWTPEEEQKIIEMVEDGRTNREISAVLGRSKLAVEARIDSMRKRGIDIPRNRWGGDHISEDFMKKQEEEMKKVKGVTAAEMPKKANPAPEKESYEPVELEIIEAPEPEDFSITRLRSQIRELLKREAELLEFLTDVRGEKADIARELDDLLALVVNGENGEEESK